MTFQLIDLIRPGVGLLDEQEWDWDFVGELMPTTNGSRSRQWEDKWRRRDGSGEVLSLEQVIAKYGPVSVIIQRLTTDYRWWDTNKTFDYPNSKVYGKDTNDEYA